jgi:uncharacterized protein YgbK (DUF1537 family)
MRSGPEVVIIADDLTGAADTGVQFAAIGSPVYLIPLELMALGGRWRDSAASLSVYTNSRHLSAAAASARLGSLTGDLRSLAPRRVYKKIDSCLRGNPGAEIDVLLDNLAFDAALVAPALPAQGRTTLLGVHHVYGTPLAETAFAQDPVVAVRHSVVAAMLSSQSRHAVGEIHVQEYGEPGRLLRALERERRRGCRLIVCDATQQTHLDQVAGLVLQSPGTLLPAGSAGLFTALVRHATSRATGSVPLRPALERLLLVCGTGAPVARRQVYALLDRYPGVRRELEPEWLARASVRDHKRCAEALSREWTGGMLALQIRPLRPDSATESPSAAAMGLARLACEVIRAGGVEGIFLSGGDTAEAFFRASGGEAIRLEREVLPGLVLGRWLSGLADGLPVITKAGAFGQEQTLIALYEQLSGGIAS